VSNVGSVSTYVGREPHGLELAAVVIVLALANFLAILDTTIANVLVSHIAGSLATSPSNGTWVITGYGVAEAIMVPLTGWLAERFGPVKVFITCIVGFALFSLLCGMATSLEMLIAFRILLGISGGPLIPLSQTLLLKIVPSRHLNSALTVWSMGSVLAPIAGPVIGGLIGDNLYWGWAFYFKVPLALGIAFLAWRILMPHETSTIKAKVDFIGLGLLVLWVGALQVMLGNGQDKDWFNSQFIVVLCIAVLLGFVSFVAWEMTDRKPIVDLRIFSNRAFAVSMAVIALAFGTMFGGIVLVPLWLQTSMGYTATWAGYNSALSGITMVIFAPITTWLMTRYDLRGIVFIGLLISAASNLMRVGYNDTMTFWQLMWPQLVFGVGMVMTVVPLIEMSTSSLDDKDIASGSGQFNFVRTLASAISTASVVALWNNQVSSNKAALVGALHDPAAAIGTAQSSGISGDAARNVLDLMVQGQSVQQATNNTFLIMGVITLAAAACVWLAPKPPKKSGGGTPMGH
jgi:MFS transporter, DHA2 family, multidrug resistance protein